MRAALGFAVPHTAEQLFTVAFDASSSTVEGTGIADPSWTHTPSGTPRGAVVLVVHNGAGLNDEVSGVTYGGTAMTEVLNSPVLHATGAEDGVLYAYFLGSAVPTGAQTVVVTRVNSVNPVMACACVTVTSDAPVTSVYPAAVLDSGDATNPSVVVGTDVGVETAVVGALHTGTAAVGSVAPGADYSDIFEHDYGNQVVSFIRRSASASGGNVTVDWTAAAEEAGVIAVAIRGGS